METYIFLDESGDLGFNFQKHTSRHFTITLLVVQGKENARKLRKATEKTLKRKLNLKNTRRSVHELKATNTTLPIKQYFYTQVREVSFALFTCTLDKRSIQDTTYTKEELYNFVTYQTLIDMLEVYADHASIHLTIDRSKSKLGIRTFDEYIKYSFPETSFTIHHIRSQKESALQVCDMFCWGIFQSHETQNDDWFYWFASEKLASDRKLKI